MSKLMLISTKSDVCDILLYRFNDNKKLIATRYHFSAILLAAYYDLECQ